LAELCTDTNLKERSKNGADWEQSVKEAKVCPHWTGEEEEEEEAVNGGCIRRWDRECLLTATFRASKTVVIVFRNDTLCIVTDRCTPSN
jgi:hypothetical protein